MGTDIAIVGAGVAGLTLARVLKVNGIASTVYELDAGPDERRLGGMLDLTEAHGQYALRAGGLLDDFRSRVQPGADAIRIFDRAGRLLMDEVDDGEGRRPEISRSDLRTMLLESIDSDSVVWGKKVSRLDLDGARPELHFTDGTSANADLVVGADGAWSAVRRALTDILPVYSGISQVELRLHDVDAKHTASAAFVGKGTLISMNSGQGVIVQRNGDGSVRTYVSFQADEETIAGLADIEPSEVFAQLRTWFDGWSPEVLELISTSDEPIAVRAHYALPDEAEWAPARGATLVGDAAHLMSPFGGYGANLAMLDAALLGESIAAHPGDIAGAVADYEADLFPRSHTFARETSSNLKRFHGGEPSEWIVGLYEGYRGTTVPQR